MAKKKQKIRFVAAIDIGSNSIKMSMARLNHKTRIILEDKSALRLLEKNQTKITSQKMILLQRTLNRFVRLTREYNPEFRVFATSAMRNAKNRKSVLKTLNRKYGFRVRVISGLREAEYVSKAVREKFAIHHGFQCVVDIGGGSMELIQLLNGKTKWMKSIPFGSVVVKENFFQTPCHDVIDVAEKVLQIQHAIERRIKKPFHGHVILSGGTPSALAKIFQIQKHFRFMHGKMIDRNELQSLMPILAEQKLGRLIRQYKINPSRRDLLLPCLCTILALMRITQQDSFRISRTGLRQGIIAEAFSNR